MKASSALARGNRVFRRFFRDPARASFRRSGSSHRSRTSRQPAGPNRPKSVLQVSRQTLTFRPATRQHVLSAYDRNSGKVSATSDDTGFRFGIGRARYPSQRRREGGNPACGFQTARPEKFRSTSVGTFRPESTPFAVAHHFRHAAGHRLHHLARVLELLEQPVDFLNRRTAARSDALLAAAVQNRRILALGGSH